MLYTRHWSNKQGQWQFSRHVSYLLSVLGLYFAGPSRIKSRVYKFHRCTQPELKKVAKEPAFAFLNERLEERKGKGMKLYNIQRTETKGKIPRGELKRRFSRLLQFFFWARRFLPVGTSGEEISRRRIFCSEGNGILSVKLKLWFDIQSNVVGPAVQGRSQDHCSLSVKYTEAVER